MNVAEPRLAVRVLLADQAGRVLLLESVLPDGLTLWVPPGGGIEENETPEEAVLREVEEETGIRLNEPGSCVWLRRTTFFGQDQGEQFFFTHVDGSPVVNWESNPDAAELATLRSVRWWTPDKIQRAATGLTFVPREPGIMILPLLAGQIPPEPFEVGV